MKRDLKNYLYFLSFFLSNFVKNYIRIKNTSWVDLKI